MNTQHHPVHLNKFHGGVNQDVNPELLGSGDKGEYFDGRNMRPSDIEGDLGVAKKIKGEVAVYPKVVAGTFRCIGSVEVNYKIVEFWVDPNEVLDPYVRIDGVVVLQSDQFPVNINFPLQIGKNESCIGGEIYITDFNASPMTFNIQDLLDNVGGPKYFSGFNLENYAMFLSVSQDHPVFIEIVNVGTGAGLPVGSYVYTIRYANDAGDKTNFSAPTPPIKIPQVNGVNSDQYPYTRTMGATPDIGNQTTFSPKIRFRVNNIFGYEFVEIRRHTWNAGNFIGYVPPGEIVGRVSVTTGEFSIRDFVDQPGGANSVEPPEPLTLEEGVNRMLDVSAAKAVRYFNNRVYLMNIKYAGRDIETAGLVFKEIDGQKMFPVIRNLGKSGYGDPYQDTYYKSLMRGERHGWAIALHDGKGGTTFAKFVPGFENYLTPNRREELTANEYKWSYLGAVKAATVDGSVGHTAEVFDLKDAVSKTDKCQFKILLDGGEKLKGTVNSLGCPDPGHGDFVNGNEVGYRPFNPVADSDGNFSGHNYVVNHRVDTGPGLGDWANYNPKGFAPNYYSLGMALAGVENFPGWARSFSIYRTQPAKRVVCQGIGFYSIESGELAVTGNKKEKDRWWFYAPDIAAGITDADDIISNPGNYEVQLVSPLGFFSEVYDHDNTAFDHRATDMMTYARVLYEDGSINVGDNIATVGNAGYVAYGSWRNGAPSGGNPFVGKANGNTVFPLTSFTRQTNGFEGPRGGSYFELRINDFVYDNGTAGAGNTHFSDSGVRNWHEPFYIINIVASGKNVPNSDTTEFIPTGIYQKLESKIGVSDGTANQSFKLVDERWEDVIPTLVAGHVTQNNDRYIYLRDQNGIDYRWINITFKTGPQISAIKAALLPGEGVYRHTNQGNKEFEIVFNDPDYAPHDELEVIVKYDSDAPIQCFGGDTHIGEAIFSPLDLQFTSDGNRVDALDFKFEIAFPYLRFEINPRVYIVNNVTGVNRIQDDNTAKLKWMRQLACMFTCESKVDTSRYYNNLRPEQFFPAINYIMRPHRWDASNPQNNIHTEYFDDYPDENETWEYGGFRFLPQHNIDYSHSDLVNIVFKKPTVGFNDQTHFCTRVIWSLKRAVNTIDAPGVRTFPDLNFFDISDDSGEIKFAWDALSDKGTNLYAFTDTGICLLLSDKRIITEKTGSELATAGAEDATGVLEEYWINREIGMNQEMWRSAAEFGNKIFFANHRSAYRFENNGLKDLGRTGYFSKIYPFLQRMREGYLDEVTAGYDRKMNEYVLYIKQDGFEDTFAFSELMSKWCGGYDYKFDRFVSIENRLYGQKGGGETYELGVGYMLNDQPIRFEVVFAIAPEQYFDKEFKRVRINTSARPTEDVEFMEDRSLAVVARIPASQLQDRRGFEDWIPRKDAAPRDRIQGRVLFCRIIHNLEEEFHVVDVGTMYAKLK